MVRFSSVYDEGGEGSLQRETLIWNLGVFSALLGWCYTIPEPRTEPQGWPGLKGKRQGWFLRSQVVFCCCLVLLAGAREKRRTSCFYKSCLLGVRSLSVEALGTVADAVSNHRGYWVNLALMVCAANGFRADTHTHTTLTPLS